MYIYRLKISGLRGVQSADITFGKHSVLVGPNISGKTTIIEAMALLLGRDRLVRRLTEHDFNQSRPSETSRIQIIATISGFPENDPQHSPSWSGATEFSSLCTLRDRRFQNRTHLSPPSPTITSRTICGNQEETVRAGSIRARLAHWPKWHLEQMLNVKHEPSLE